MLIWYRSFICTIKVRRDEGFYDRILSEASSVARPKEILGCVNLISSVATDGIVILVDAETFKKSSFDKYMINTKIAQLRATDLFVLTKLILFQ